MKSRIGMWGGRDKAHDPAGRGGEEIEVRKGVLRSGHFRRS